MGVSKIMIYHTFSFFLKEIFVQFSQKESRFVYFFSVNSKISRSYFTFFLLYVITAYIFNISPENHKVKKKNKINYFYKVFSFSELKPLNFCTKWRLLTEVHKADFTHSDCEKALEMPLQFRASSFFM